MDACKYYLCGDLPFAKSSDGLLCSSRWAKLLEALRLLLVLGVFWCMGRGRTPQSARLAGEANELPL